MNNRITTLVVDFVAVFLFAVFAAMAHELSNVFNVFWPFGLGAAIGWAIIWTRANADTIFGRTFSHGAVIWIATVVTGLVIWGIRNAKFPHWSFILVASVMSALLLLGWRGIAALAAKKSKKA